LLLSRPSDQPEFFQTFPKITENCIHKVAGTQKIQTGQQQERWYLRK
jgi:hypothetical protein